MSDSSKVMVCGAFDDIKSPDLRFLLEASRLGELVVWLWPDALIERLSGRPPKFPLAERLYFLSAVRYVNRVEVAAADADPDAPPPEPGTTVWADTPASANDARKVAAAALGTAYRVFTADELAGFPEPPPMPSAPGRRKVVATGCYDWFHSGHVRFTEEAAAYGDLYVCLGNDANVRQLKGEGHPLLSQEERRFVVGSIKHVKQALISTGFGWLDADPEIGRLRPDCYIVNEDGDKGGKREYCAELGIEYIVLQRTPAPGLQRRSSTDLRGF
jgi:cytidyltransferase-like protein